MILQVVVAGMEESTLKSTAMVSRDGEEERMEGRREGGRGRVLATAALTGNGRAELSYTPVLLSHFSANY